MARKINSDFTYDEMENEVLYTRAGLAADPDASDLVSMTDGWMAIVDQARAQDRAARAATHEAAAQRAIANRRLDDQCRNFGRELAMALKNDRKSPRWTRFFRATVDAFLAQPMGAQAASVIAWLSIEDDVLTRHSEWLGRWAHAAQAALTTTNASAQVRGSAIIARESAGEALTKGRDGLEAALMQRALERNLGRDYAAGFFIVQDRKKASKSAPEEPAPAL
jgi:hypothetical protein